MDKKALMEKAKTPPTQPQNKISYSQRFIDNLGWQMEKNNG